MRTMIPIQSSEDAYPYSVRDVHISDPCILADEASGLYYTYAQFVDSQRFPGAAVDEPASLTISGLIES